MGLLVGTLAGRWNRQASGHLQIKSSPWCADLSVPTGLSDSSDVEENKAPVDPEGDGAFIASLDLLEEDLLEQITLERFGGSKDCGVSDEER